MKINNMRMMAIGLLLSLIAAVFVGLFYLPIPEGQGDIIYMGLGMVIDNLGHLLSSTFSGRFKSE